MTRVLILISLAIIAHSATIVAATGTPFRRGHKRCVDDHPHHGYGFNRTTSSVLSTRTPQTKTRSMTTSVIFSTATPVITTSSTAPAATLTLIGKPTSTTVFQVTATSTSKAVTKPVGSTTQAASTVPAVSSSSAAAPTSSSPATSSADIAAYLKGHNDVRAQYGAKDLIWADDLAAAAQSWADKCNFVHSGGVLGAFGENLAAGTGAYSIASGLKAWTDEASAYTSSSPVPSHFTQVVWKGTSEVGCAVQACDGIFDVSYGKAQFYVCEYRNAGNVIGQFPENVQA